MSKSTCSNMLPKCVLGPQGRVYGRNLSLEGPTVKITNNNEKAMKTIDLSIYYVYLSIYLAYVSPLQKEGLVIPIPSSILCYSHPCNTPKFFDVIHPTSTLSASSSGLCSWCPVSNIMCPSIIFTSCKVACPSPFLCF